MALYGLDESHYQTTLTGQDFAILKATEGTGFVDPTCDVKYQANKAAGKLLGVYHFASFSDPVAEANYFVDNCSGYIGEALLALDVETHTDVTWAKQWLDQVYARTQVRPLIYMSASTAIAVDWSPVAANYALWAAGYPAKFDVANPPTPLASGADMPYDTGVWPLATIWQYTSSAGTLDRDIAYMTLDAWHKFAQGDRSETPSPTPEPAPAPSVPDPTPPVTSQPTPEPVTSAPDTPATTPAPNVPTDTPNPAPVPVSGTPAEPTPEKPVIKGETMKTKVQDLMERAAWTFLQAAVAALAITNGSVSKTALLGAVAAGLSAVKTILKQSIFS